MHSAVECSHYSQQLVEYNQAHDKVLHNSQVATVSSYMQRCFIVTKFWVAFVFSSKILYNFRKTTQTSTMEWCSANIVNTIWATFAF